MSALLSGERELKTWKFRVRWCCFDYEKRVVCFRWFSLLSLVSVIESQYLEVSFHESS
jgi:hypothetical protein